MLHAIGLRCCGLQEIYNLSSHRSTTAAFKRLLRIASPGQAYIFTEAANDTYGQRLADYINDKGNIGHVTKLPSFRNANSENIVQTYFWVYLKA